MAEFVCWNCGRETEYEGEGYWHCEECKMSFFEGYNDEDAPEGEGLSVYEAATIWASHGKDEDYMFGYSEDELESVL